MFEIYKELRKYKKELKKEYLKKKYILSSKADVGILEDAVQECNMNPNLQVDIKLGDGTIISLKTTKEKRATNPLFTDAIYND